MIDVVIYLKIWRSHLDQPIDRQITRSQIARSIASSSPDQIITFF